MYTGVRKKVSERKRRWAKGVGSVNKVSEKTASEVWCGNCEKVSGQKVSECKKVLETRLSEL